MRRAGVSILEVLAALLIIVTLLAITIPSLFTAREASYRGVCMNNQRVLGQAWIAYIKTYESFPYVPVEPAWRWGGNVAGNVSGNLIIDTTRPLYTMMGANDVSHLYCCPADRGITDELGITGTGDRTACESFGTSYRANSLLLDARLSGVDSEARPLRPNEVTATPSRLVVMGDAFWYEVLEHTGRHANWHGKDNEGNLLFLDGSVHTRPVLPRPQVGQAIFDPVEEVLELPAASTPPDPKKSKSESE